MAWSIRLVALVALGACSFEGPEIGADGGSDGSWVPPDCPLDCPLD